MNRVIDKLNGKNDDLQLQNEKLSDMYKVAIEDKNIIEDKMLSLNTEKERAENALIKKAIMFSELSDEVIKEKEKLTKQNFIL